MQKANDRLAKLVKHQLDGDKDQRLIAEIMLIVRFITSGTETIKELGDFEAHREDRTKGLATDRCRDFFYNMQMQMQKMYEPSRSTIVPTYLSRVVSRVFEDLNSKIIANNTGFPRSVAYRYLQSAKSKIQAGEILETYIKRLSEPEKIVMQMCTSAITVVPIFDQISIMKDYCFVLKKNRAIIDEEESRLLHLGPDLMLYAISLMHNKHIVIEPGYNAKTTAVIDDDGTLGVMASADIAMGENRKQTVAFQLVSSNLDFKDYVSASLVDATTKLPLSVKFKSDMSYNVAKFEATGEWPAVYGFVDDVTIRNRKIEYL